MKDIKTVNFTFIMSRIILILLLSLTACAKNYRLDKFDLYAKTNIQKSEFSPVLDKKILEDTRKVAIVDFTIPADKAVTDQDLNSVATSHLTDLISKDGYAKVLDRTLTAKISKEIALQEIKNPGKIANFDPQVSDFIITGSISEATFSSKLVSNWFANVCLTALIIVGTLLSGRYNNSNAYIPSQYKYTAAISGVVKVIETSTGKEVFNKTFKHKEESSETAEVGVPGWFSNTTLKPVKTSDNALMSLALQNGIASIKNGILNAISPIGYIVERRDINAEHPAIFRLSFGSDDGIKMGQKIKIIGERGDYNDITGTKDVVKRTVAYGVVSNEISKDFAWVIVKDKEAASIIKIGDYGLIEFNDKSSK